MERRILDWNPNADKFSKPKELLIHQKLHSYKSEGQMSVEQIWGGKRSSRILAIEKSLKLFNKKITGKVLEVGAGDGWCSAYLLKHKNISEMFTMECNQAAIEQLIPKTFSTLKISESNLTLVMGSFNDIRKESYFDSVVAMGALHHSANLHKTLSEIYKALKPGGFLLAQEPYMDNTTPNTYYEERENQEIVFWGLETLKNSERSDVFYRLCEYQTAAYHVGFNFKYFNVDEESFFTKIKKIWKKDTVVKPKNLMMVLEKPNKHFIPPTSWELN